MICIAYCCPKISRRKQPEKAIINTFQRRGTGYTDNHPIFHSDFGTNPKRSLQWRSFLKKSNLDQSIDLEEVIRQIDEYLRPIFESMRI